MTIPTLTLTSLLLLSASLVPIRASVIGGITYRAPLSKDWSTVCTAPMSCTATGLQATLYWPDQYIPVFVSYTLTGDDNSLSLWADSDFQGGSVSGSATSNGSITFDGGSGVGSAQFELGWKLTMRGGDGSMYLTGPGIQITGFNNGTVSGATWSDSLPFTWGQPLLYSFGLRAAMLDNLWGDCCEGFTLSASIVDWRVSGGGGGINGLLQQPVPEPGTFALFAVTLIAILSLYAPSRGVPAAILGRWATAGRRGK